MKRMLSILLAVCALALSATALAEADPADAAAVEPPAETPAAQTEGEADVAEAPDPAADEAQSEAVRPEDAGFEVPDDADATGVDVDAEAPEPIRLWFEEGFGLSFPQGWVSYPVSEADRAAGMRYALGDGDGQCRLFIQTQPTHLESVDALTELIGRNASLERTGDLTFGDEPFVAFIDAAQNLSGCATLWRGEIVAFLFTPQSDSASMMTATEIMESFAAH